MAESVLQQTDTKHSTPDPSTSSAQPFPKRQRLEGELHKRVPQRLATVPTDIYVSRKSAFGAQLARAKKLLFVEGHASITIHGLGAAIERALSLALALQEATHDQVELRCTTGTVGLVDDVAPEDMDEDLSTQTRQNSAVHIQVTAKQPIPPLTPATSNASATTTAAAAAAATAVTPTNKGTPKRRSQFGLQGTQSSVGPTSHRGGGSGGARGGRGGTRGGKGGGGGGW